MQNTYKIHTCTLYTRRPRRNGNSSTQFIGLLNEMIIWETNVVVGYYMSSGKMIENHPSIHSFIHPSIHPFIQPASQPASYPSFHPPTQNPPIHPSIHPSIH